MPLLGFEPTISAFERAKTVRALDRAATVIGFFLASAPRPNQSPIQWVPGALSPGVKQTGREAHHSPPFSAEVKNGGAIPPFSHASSRCVATSQVSFCAWVNVCNMAHST
jgi:hypothetical protein